MGIEEANLEGGADLVGEGLAPYALAALARAGGVTGLYHEALDISVPEAIVIIARRAEGEEILSAGHVIIRGFRDGARKNVPRQL